MYVNPFWFGMFFTVFAEMLLCLVFAAYLGSKNNHNNKK